MFGLAGTRPRDLRDVSFGSVFLAIVIAVVLGGFIAGVASPALQVLVGVDRGSTWRGDVVTIVLAAAFSALFLPRLLEEFSHLRIGYEQAFPAMVAGTVCVVAGSRFVDRWLLSEPSSNRDNRAMLELILACGTWFVAGLAGYRVLRLLVRDVKPPAWHVEAPAPRAQVEVRAPQPERARLAGNTRIIPFAVLLLCAGLALVAFALH
jgi:hypothetical protein